MAIFLGSRFLRLRLHHIWCCALAVFKPAPTNTAARGGKTQWHPSQNDKTRLLLHPTAAVAAAARLLVLPVAAMPLRKAAAAGQATAAL